MKKITKSLIAVLLIATMLVGTIVPSFATPVYQRYYIGNEFLSTAALDTRCKPLENAEDIYSAKTILDAMSPVGQKDVIVAYGSEEFYSMMKVILNGDIVTMRNASNLNDANDEYEEAKIKMATNVIKNMIDSAIDLDNVDATVLNYATTIVDYILYNFIKFTSCFESLIARVDELTTGNIIVVSVYNLMGTYDANVTVGLDKNGNPVVINLSKIYNYFLDFVNLYICVLAKCAPSYKVAYLGRDNTVCSYIDDFAAFDEDIAEAMISTGKSVKDYDALFSIIRSYFMSIGIDYIEYVQYYAVKEFYKTYGTDVISFNAGTSSAPQWKYLNDSTPAGVAIIEAALESYDSFVSAKNSKIIGVQDNSIAEFIFKGRVWEGYETGEGFGKNEALLSLYKYYLKAFHACVISISNMFAAACANTNIDMFAVQTIMSNYRSEVYAQLKSTVDYIADYSVDSVVSDEPYFSYDDTVDYFSNNQLLSLDVLSAMIRNATINGNEHYVINPCKDGYLEYYYALVNAQSGLDIVKAGLFTIYSELDEAGYIEIFNENVAALKALLNASYENGTKAIEAKLQEEFQKTLVEVQQLSKVLNSYVISALTVKAGRLEAAAEEDFAEIYDYLQSNFQKILASFKAKISKQNAQQKEIAKESFATSVGSNKELLAALGIALQERLIEEYNLIIDTFCSNLEIQFEIQLEEMTEDSMLNILMSVSKFISSDRSGKLESIATSAQMFAGITQQTVAALGQKLTKYQGMAEYNNSQFAQLSTNLVLAANEFKASVDNFNTFFGIDVQATNAWVAGKVQELFYKCVEEYSKGTTPYEAAANASRALVVNLLYAMDSGKEAIASKFADVQDEAFMAAAIGWAAYHGIVKGYGNELFGPEDAITLEQIVTILYRYAQYKNIYFLTEAAPQLEVIENASEWAQEAIAWAYNVGLFEFLDFSIGTPLMYMTNAQVTTLMAVFAQKVNATESLAINTLIKASQKAAYKLNALQAKVEYQNSVVEQSIQDQINYVKNKIQGHVEYRLGSIDAQNAAAEEAAKQMVYAAISDVNSELGALYSMLYSKYDELGTDIKLANYVFEQLHNFGSNHLSDGTMVDQLIAKIAFAEFKAQQYFDIANQFHAKLASYFED